MTRPTVGQPVEFSHVHWKGPSFRSNAHADWPEEYGLAGEDWNFAFDHAVDGWIYGYGQGRIGKGRLRAAKGKFDVLFYYREPGGSYRAAGLYQNAEYLDGDAIKEARTLLKKNGNLRRRKDEIRRALTGRPAGDIKEVTKVLTGKSKQDPWLRWRVKVDHVHVFETAPKISPKRSTDWRHTNAYNWSDHPWTGLGLSVPYIP